MLFVGAQEIHKSLREGGIHLLSCSLRAGQVEGECGGQESINSLRGGYELDGHVISSTFFNRLNNKK